MKESLIFQALDPVVQALDALGIPYQIIGSVASSAYGIALATLDVDLTADMNDGQVSPFVERLRDAYYLDEDRIRDAAARRSSFNAIHLESMVKVDIFLLKSKAYDQAAFARRHIENLGENMGSRPLCIASPEDVILYKLDWYHQSGRVSERQWSDVLGVLKVQHASLNVEYMHKWAATLGLTGLLQQALRDAGINKGNPSPE
jgi:hypothetical protein